MQVPHILRDIEFDDGDIINRAALQEHMKHSASPLSVLREALSEGTARLEQLFHQGLSAARLVPARARLIDTLLAIVWERYFQRAGQDLALLAVGGYGRGELHPGSDVDLMVLVDSERALSRHQEAIEAFLTFLWDMRLEVGQSVRTPDDCVQHGAADVTVTTNLMESRLLQGSAQLFADMRRRVRPEHIWPSRPFFEAKRDEQHRRHLRYHDTAYNLEPNVKEGPGGLRDLQTIGWVAKRHFGAETLHDLVEQRFLTEREYQELIGAQSFLWRVRFALHALAGRREDRLLFDYQHQIADQFGYQDDGHNLAIELFMQRYYRTVMNLCRLNEMLLQLFEEAILLVNEPSEPVIINRRFLSRKGYIEARRADVFSRYPYAMLEVFLVFQQHGELKGLRASTIRLLHEHLHLIDERFRLDLRARSLFMEILRQPRGVTRALRLMSGFGVLGAYLPEYGRISGRMQYDLFHAYTVDQHTLFVIRNLRRLYLPEFAHEFPLCSEIMARIPKPELLYVAALYHDIAKGRGGDHSTLGAVDAETFCNTHALSKFDTRLVTWLVENHLLMSVTAQKTDVNDPDAVHQFARAVGDQLYLDYLYVLTVSDIRATNPSLWNSWREALLKELYLGTRRSLRRGIENPVDRDERIRESKAQARDQLQRKGISSERIETVWDGFLSDYFLRHSVAEIVWHTRAVLKKADDDRALVLTRDNPRGTELFVYQRNRDMLFATTTAVLDQMGLTVVDARILTAHTDYALDSYTVLEANGAPIADRARIRKIADRLRRALNSPHYTVTPSQRRTPRQLQHFSTPTTVSFGSDEIHRRTVLEVITADRPGLLSRIGEVFRRNGVRLHSARIATLGERVEDVFFVTDLTDEPFTDPDRQASIRASLVRQLESDRPKAVA